MTATLPNDVARCFGTTASLCSHCRRRLAVTSGIFMWHVEPAISESGGCQNFIEPAITTTAEQEAIP